MEKLTMQKVKQFWDDQNYMNLIRYDINHFCQMWAEEEGIRLPDTFDIANFNSMFFTKMNSEKHAMNAILEKFGYPIVETESLTFDKECAIKRAKQLFKEQGNGVIRANKMAGGGGTFVIKEEKSIPMMISTLIHNPKGKILPLFSPFYKAPIEYGVFIVNGKVELCIAKKLNKETGLHNLSLGAKADVVRDEKVLVEMEKVSSGLSELLGIGFGRIDVLSTEQGPKIVELSVPNFKKFSIQDEKSMKISKELFLKYHHTFYK